MSVCSLSACCQLFRQVCCLSNEACGVGQYLAFRIVGRRSMVLARWLLPELISFDMSLLRLSRSCREKPFDNLCAFILACRSGACSAYRKFGGLRVTASIGPPRLPLSCTHVDYFTLEPCHCHLIRVAILYIYKVPISLLLMHIPTAK